MAKSKSTKQETIDEITELLGKIEKAEEAVSIAQANLDSKKEEAKLAKGVWQERVQVLRELCRTRKKWAAEAKKQPLFRQKKNGKATTDKSAGPLDDKWKKNSLAAAAISEKYINKLEEAGIHTLGELQDKMNKHGQFWARELKLSRQRVAIEDEFNKYLMEITPKETSPVTAEQPQTAEAIVSDAKAKMQ